MDPITKQHLNTLDLTENATFKDVIAAYRRLKHEYHPDKVDKMGLDKKSC